jgi:hypothetical protein
MASNKRNKQQREKDLAYISELYLQGYSYRAMAEQLNLHNSGLYTLSHQQVSLDVRELLKRWHDRQEELTDRYIVRELEKLDKVEHEYWLAWERSKQEKTKRTIKDRKQAPKPGSEDRKAVAVVGGMQERTVTKEQLLGDATYLQGVERCIEKRCKLLGLNKEITVNAVGSFNFNYVVPSGGNVPGGAGGSNTIELSE